MVTILATTRVRKDISGKRTSEKKIRIVEAERYEADKHVEGAGSWGSLYIYRGNAESKWKTNYLPVEAIVSCSTTRRKKSCLAIETNWGAWNKRCRFPNVWDCEKGTNPE
jgi:hypothetical protein